MDEKKNNENLSLMVIQKNWTLNAKMFKEYNEFTLFTVSFYKNSQESL